MNEAGETHFRVLIVDDHQVVRAALVRLVAEEPDLELIGAASNGADALALTRTFEPEVVVLDVSMPGESGWDVLPRLLEAHPAGRVILLSVEGDRRVAAKALAAGAAGYVLKEAVADELLPAVRAVAGGGQYVSAAI